MRGKGISMSEVWKLKIAKELDAREQALLAKRQKYSAGLIQVSKELNDLEATRRTLGLPPSGAARAEEGEPARRAGHFKDVALELLKEAYPAPMKASEILAKAEKRLGRKYHPKTAGMSLYRMASPEGGALVRREGHRWYFVPQKTEGPEPTGPSEKH